MSNGYTISLWSLSLLLSVVALGLMSALILRRAFNDRAEERREELVAAGTREVFRAMEGDAAAADVVRACNGRPIVLTERVLEIAALVRGPDREALSVLLEQLGIAAHLHRQLKSWRAALRRRAAERLALFNRGETIMALTAALDDRSPHVRLAAAVSLSELGKPPAFDRLLKQLSVGAEFRSATLRVLFRKLAREQPIPLLATLRRDPPSALKVLLIEALGKSGRYGMEEVFIHYCRDPDKEVRSEVLRSLASLEHPAILQLAARRLEDPAWEVRLQAATVAGRARFTSLIPAVSRLLDDEVWWVRFRSAEALVAMGEAGIARLREVAGEATGRAGEAARLILMERRVV